MNVTAVKKVLVNLKFAIKNDSNRLSQDDIDNMTEAEKVTEDELVKQNSIY